MHSVRFGPICIGDYKGKRYSLPIGYALGPELISVSLGIQPAGES